MKKTCIERRDIKKIVKLCDSYTIVVQPVLFHCRYRELCRFCKEPDEPNGIYKTRKISECKTYLRYCKKFGDEIDLPEPKFTVSVITGK